MFLGILIGIALYGLLLIVCHGDPSPEHRRLVARMDPAILASVRMHGTARLIGWFFLLIGFCGAVGWIIEILV